MKDLTGEERRHERKNEDRNNKERVKEGINNYLSAYLLALFCMFCFSYLVSFNQGHIKKAGFFLSGSGKFF